MSHNTVINDNKNTQNKLDNYSYSTFFKND